MLFLTSKNEDSLDNFKRFNANSWEDLKTRISYKLVNKKVFHASINAEELVYEDCMDLSKVYIVTELTQDRKKMMSYALKNSDLEKFDKKLEDVVEQVHKNYKQDRTRRIRTLKEDILSHETMYPLMNSIKDVMLQGANALIEDSSESNDNVLVITNKYNVYGASYMLDFNTLEEVYQRMKSSFYIIPLSVHQFMCVNDKYISKNKDLYEAEDDLLDMLFEINSSSKKEEDILTYRIYHYMADDGKIIFPIKQQL